MNDTKANEKLVEKVLDLAVEIQKIPAPTFSEADRSNFIHEMFQKENLSDVSQDDLGNVFARILGNDDEHPLVVSAHLDTVFPLETDLTVNRSDTKVHGPGIGDNVVGIAGLFGLLWMLERNANKPSKDIWLVANVGEEGLGNLVGMKAVVERFGGQPAAYIVLEGMAYGRVYHRGLGVSRFRINTHTKGGHSWVNFGNPSAVHELAALVNQLAGIPLSENPRTTLNVGKIEGGISINTIAQNAHLELDLRSTDSDSLQELHTQVEEIVKAANRDGVVMEIKPFGERPIGALLQDHPLVQIASETLIQQGIRPDLNVGSTDANIPLSLGYPAICIGLTTGSGAHTLQENINIPPLAEGFQQLYNLVVRASDELDS